MIRSGENHDVFGGLQRGGIDAVADRHHAVNRQCGERVDRVLEFGCRALFGRRAEADED
jgi:hypothetical protein